AGKQRGEELGRIAQFLCRDASPMPLRGANAVHMLRTLAQLAMALFEYRLDPVAGERRRGSVCGWTPERGEECAQRQQQLLELRRRNGIAGERRQPSAPRRGPRAQPCDIAIATELGRDLGQRLQRKYIAIARGAEHRAQSAQLLLERIYAPCWNEERSELEQRAQAAPAHAQLMQVFRIGRGEHSRGVDLDLRDAVAGNRGQRSLRAGVGRRDDVAGTPRRDRRSRRECVPAFGLARMQDAYRQIGGECGGELEQPRGVALLELNLDLGDRRAPPPGT